MTENNIDHDVHNMARWGIDFRDTPETFHGQYLMDTHRANIWNYIDFFGQRRGQPTMGNESRIWTGGDTPVFWWVWNESTFSPENRHNPFAHRDEGTEFLADWERDLLGLNEDLAWQTIRQGNYSNYIRDLILAG